MNLVVMELKPVEVEFLQSLGRCGRCDHLGVFHHEQHMEEEADTEHCDGCIDAGNEETCHGVPLSTYYPSACLIDGCKCEDYR